MTRCHTENAKQEIRSILHEYNLTREKGKAKKQLTMNITWRKREMKTPFADKKGLSQAIELFEHAKKFL